jgi:hypothetical protein
MNYKTLIPIAAVLLFGWFFVRPAIIEWRCAKALDTDEATILSLKFPKAYEHLHDRCLARWGSI